MTTSTNKPVGQRNISRRPNGHARHIPISTLIEEPAPRGSADIHPLLRNNYRVLPSKLTSLEPTAGGGSSSAANHITAPPVQAPPPQLGTSSPLATPIKASSSYNSHSAARPFSLVSSSARPSLPRSQFSDPRISTISLPNDASALRSRDPNTSAPVNAALRLLRKNPAPAIFSRLKLPNKRRPTTPTTTTDVDTAGSVGRTSESSSSEVDLHDFNYQRARAWSGNIPPRVELSLPAIVTAPQARKVSAASSPHVGISFQSTVMAALGKHEDSDISSIISTSDHHLFTESDDSDGPVDTNKYRMPDAGKSRGSSRNGFVLEDGRAINRDVPPSPPPKDAMYLPSRSSTFASTESLSGPDRDGPYFNPYGLQRTGSVWTLSRASLSNQLSQLTSIKLPDASSLESSISSIPTSVAAARVLTDASNQINMWIAKAKEVLETLDAEDDIEWAAAAGPEGLADVDSAIQVFETLILVFVNAIENLESRPDISQLPTQDQEAIVGRMERILEEWEKIKGSLKATKEQVELAMEWEELWNNVLGEIGMELEKLNRLIFEMEERRHKNSLLDQMAEPGQGLDIKELETIVEEAPSRIPDVKAGNGKLGLVPGLDEDSNLQQAASQDESHLIALTARMQPLRASLDFLPMRLASFLNRTKGIFPSACDELNSRRKVLDQKYQKLESDAEALRKELGEDQWVAIFHKAGGQALKMCESVERSVAKLRDDLDEGAHHSNPAALHKKTENYEAKKEHYGPAILQVIAIIDRGVASRLTVNGEILRLQQDIKRRWADLEGMMKSMDFALDQLNIAGSRHLRDSISTVFSEQRSVTSSAGTLIDTPGSSPASSVILLGRRASEHGSTTPFSSKSRQSSFTSQTTARGKRLSSLPTPHKTPVSKSSASNLRSGVVGVSSRLYPGPPPRSVSRQEMNESRPSRPKWNSSTNMKDTNVGHNFKPLSVTDTSPYRKQIPILRSPKSYAGNLSASTSSIPSPLGLGTPSRPASTVPPSTLPSLSKSTSSAALRPPKPSALPGTPRSALPRAASAFTTPSTARHISASSIASSSSTLTDRTTKPSSSATDPSDDSPSRSTRSSRPSTALNNRRISLLPQPKRQVSGTTATQAATAAMNGARAPTPSGRSSRAGRNSSLGMRDESGRPRWRG